MSGIFENLGIDSGIIIIILLILTIFLLALKGKLANRKNPLPLEKAA